jgi:hypothetical protein
LEGEVMEYGMELTKMMKKYEQKEYEKRELGRQ